MRMLCLFNLLTTLLFAATLVPRAGAVTTSACQIRDASAAPPALWLLCADGTVSLSNDAGATWSQRQVSSPEQLRAIVGLDSRRAFVGGDHGTLLATEDAGRSWKSIPVPADERLTSIYFIGESGWAAGWSGLMLHSGDGGRTWTRQPTNVTQTFECVYFTDPSHGWAVGWVGAIIRTVDGGATWQEVRSPAALWSLSSVYFRDPANGWAVGFLGQILRSRDGGLSWTSQPSPVRSWLASVVFDASGRGWIATDDGVLVSDDGGESWRHGLRSNHLFLTKLLSLDDSLFAVSPQGLLQLTEAGQTLKEPRRVFIFESENSPRQTDNLS